MNATDFIGSKISNEPVGPVQDIDTICAFSGQPITKGVPLKKLLSSNFTDHAYVRFKSKHASVNAAKCMQPLTKESTASLRNYSFFCTEDELIFLSRQQLLSTIESQKQTPFILAVTYGGKKHISYKAIPQFHNDHFTVFTDKGEAHLMKEHLTVLLPILKKWYTVIPAKAATTAQPTWFTKDEMLFGDAPHFKILAYGEIDYFAENAIIEPYRNLPELQLLCNCLIKTIS